MVFPVSQIRISAPSMAMMGLETLARRQCSAIMEAVRADAKQFGSYAHLKQRFSNGSGGLITQSGGVDIVREENQKIAVAQGKGQTSAPVKDDIPIRGCRKDAFHVAAERAANDFLTMEDLLDVNKIVVRLI